MLEPADYGHWVKPHMHKPWTPSSSDIQWDSQGEHVGEKNSHTDSEELRKRSLEQDSDLE